ncbi:MAG TPA: hypothetical protein VHY91_24175 [Pirellulales bacterium]|jgi:hypothetical protein|nr:hypothetical protein [Pirellulales bacterium]
MKTFLLMACGLALSAGVCVVAAGEPPAAVAKPVVKPAEAQPAKAATPADPFAWETVVRKPGLKGPLDSDPKQRDAVNEQFKAVVDFAELASVEMPAYWSLMRWSRAQSFGELQQRARRGGVDVFFKDFAEEPEKHRGELVQLELHVVRALTFDVGANPAGIKRVYEAWGVTDNDSRSNPYVIVFSEKPPQMPLGAKIDEEGTFVGYFLKDMGYEAHDNARRFAPLLIGRLRWRAKEPPPRRPGQPGPDSKQAPPADDQPPPTKEDLG